MYTVQQIRQFYAEDGGSATGLSFREYKAMFFTEISKGIYTKSASQEAFEQMIF